MPHKLKDLAVKTGSYTTATGETKVRYENVGHILQMDDGSKMMLLKRTFNPAGVPNPDHRDSIILSVFDPKLSGASSEPAPASARAGRTQPQPIDDDVPF